MFDVGEFGRIIFFKVRDVFLDFFFYLLFRDVVCLCKNKMLGFFSLIVKFFLFFEGKI